MVSAKRHMAVSVVRDMNDFVAAPCADSTEWPLLSRTSVM
jgi:hypothetical protein